MVLSITQCRVERGSPFLTTTLYEINASSVLKSRTPVLSDLVESSEIGSRVDLDCMKVS